MNGQKLFGIKPPNRSSRVAAVFWRPFDVAQDRRIEGPFTRKSTLAKPAKAMRTVPLPTTARAATAETTAAKASETAAAAKTAAAAAEAAAESAAEGASAAVPPPAE
jgi:hypothetical protein